MRTVARHGLVLTLFLALGVAYTYPLLRQFTTAMPGGPQDHDVAAFLWNIWWTRHSLLDLHTSPLWTSYVFLPFTLDLRMHTYGLLNGLLALPFQPLLGVVGSFNLVLVATLTLNGYATYLLARHFMGRDGPALAAAALMALSPAVLFHLRVGRPSFAAVWPVSLALLSLNRLALRPAWRDALGLGLSLLAAQFLDFQILLYAGLWLAVYAVWLAHRRSDAVLRWNFLKRALGGLLIGAIPFVLLFYPVLVTAAAHGYPEPTDHDTLGYSFRIQDFVTPWAVRIAFGVTLPIGALVALLTWRRSADAPWLVGGAVFLLLMLGTALQPTSIPLPFALLRRVPGLAQFRTPYRFGIPAALGLSLATGTAVTQLLARWPRRRELAASLLAVGLILLDARSAAPFVTQTYPDEAIYHRLASERNDRALLEVPVGVRSGIDLFGRGETLQYYQTVHAKPMINGMVARMPRSVFAFYRASPSLCLLAGEPVAEGADLRGDFSRILRELRIGYVIVHPARFEAARLAQVEALIASSPELALLDDTPSVRAYRVEGQP